MSRSVVLTVAFLVFFAARQGHADVHDELSGIKKEIKEKKLLLKKTKKVETQVSTELTQIDKNLHEKESNLVVLGRELKGVETTLGRTQRDMDLVRVEAERKREQIRQRLVALYKTGEMGSARMFFGAESLPQMVEGQRYMQAVLERDKQMIAEYNAKIDQLRLLKGQLERDVARKEKIKATIEVKKHEIEVEKQKKAAYLTKVREDKKSYLSSLKELEANARRLQTMVERLEARSRKSYTAKGGKSGVGSGPQLPLIPDKGFGAQKGRLSMPVKGEIVSGFGRHKHPEFNSYTISNGISIAAPAGTDIRSVFDGQVIFADYFKGYGNMVIVDHGGGFFSLYAHTSRIMKKVGTTVVRNDILA
ncbi:MAG TPA: peptidoglycan DD-metalloendopeptidase family protein, partial [Desulfatiglandales bacterium]|nr:peptidoglycan DD-metalloendopeptidase family protein [Desulfatiglandales bacterium]